jgi:Fe-S-cluster containining protein
MYSAMGYYEEILAQFSIVETAVNCDKCVTNFKCCTYRPFIANFLAGQLFRDHPQEEGVLAQWDWLIVGLSPSIQYRKQFLKNGKWGFGTNEKLLCSFYSTKTGRCGIWSARPSVCRTFFCKSSYSDQGMSYWGKTEAFGWRLEWVLLEDFLFEEGWTIDDISVIKRYLNEDYLKAPFPLPSEYRLPSQEAAAAFYKKAQAHIESKTPEYIQEILGEAGRKLQTDVIAERAKIR